MLKEKRKELRKKFNKKSEIWRIEAVIHDGNWYDVDKWKRVAKVKDESTLLNWIKENEDILIKSELGSYRVDYDEIVRWYDEQGIDPEENIVPSNFPPKLWGKTTETDVFLNAPRRRVGTVNFHADSQEILDKVVKILKGTAKVMPDKGGRHRAYGLSAVHMKNILSKGLTKDEFNSLDIKTRAILWQRELIDLPEEWLTDALTFYSEIFAPSILKSSKKTLEIYLKTEDEIHSQTVLWVISAIKKFNETASVPFSGYLSRVLRHWPYDLPNEFLGKDLARFQRERKKAIDIVNEVEGYEGYDAENIPIEMLAEEMGITVSEYLLLNDENKNWNDDINSTTLTWEDSSNEKKGVLLGHEEAQEDNGNKKDKYNMSIAAIKAGLETESWDLAYKIISQIDTQDIDEELNSKLTPKFLKAFAKHLGID